MKPKTIEEIQDEVVKEFITHAPFSTREWRFISGQTQLRLWPEICKRYAIEVAKASLGKGSEKIVEFVAADGKNTIEGVIMGGKSSITDEQNIVL